jgi:para-nitrobenzyl esterase
VPASRILAAQPSLVDPILDGTVLPRAPGNAFATGELNRVPVISGSNRDEWRLFIALGFDYWGFPLTNAAYEAATAALLGNPLGDPFVRLVLSLYPLSSYPAPEGTASAPLAFGALGTDFLFACPARTAAELLSESVPTFAYEFDDPDAPLSFDMLPASFPLGSYHAAEIQYLMDVSGEPAAFSPEQRELSDAMLRYWAKFARTGDPNTSGAPEWPRYDTATELVQSLRPPSPAAHDRFDDLHRCSELWDRF